MAGGLRGVKGFKSESGGWYLDPREIIIEPGFNKRSPEELRINVDNLKPQIRAAKGVYEALWVRMDGETAVLINGESRLTAVMELIAEGMAIDRVPARLFHNMGSEADRIAMHITANEGRPFSRADLGASYAALMNLGWSVEEISAKLGKSVGQINASLTLAEAPAELKQAISSQAVTEGAVRAAVKAGSGAVAELKDKVKAAKGKKVARTKAEPALARAVRLILREYENESKGVEPGAVEYVSVSVEALEALRKAAQ